MKNIISAPNVDWDTWNLTYRHLLLPHITLPVDSRPVFLQGL